MEDLFEILREIKDPEIEVVDIVELGIVRDAKIIDGKVVVTITPTYTGCPAIQLIQDQIRDVLQKRGYSVELKLTYSPPWTTDWITDEAREKLRAYGISPPSCGAGVGGKEDLISISSGKSEAVECPYCRSKVVVLQSEFGSTACKSLYTCSSCTQPFEHFKRL